MRKITSVIAREEQCGGVLEGIRALSLERSKANVLFPRIVVECLIGRQSPEEFRTIRKLALEAGADTVKFKTLRLDNLSDAESADNQLPIDTRLRRYIVEGDHLKMKRIRQTCRRLEHSAVIAWNGDIYPCCFYLKFFAPFGNVFDTKFGAIWRGESLREFREVVNKDRDQIPMCRNCTEGLPFLYANPIKQNHNPIRRAVDFIKSQSI